MVNQYKGDSHFDPSGGIELNNAIVEDGELEYKGYVFSKDSEENKKLKKEMRLRKLRTDDDDYVTDAISRRSLNRAAIPLVESHEKKRIDRLMADLEKAEKQMDEAGIPPQGDMPLDPSMMSDPSMGLPMMGEGGFVPKITTNQQYDQTFIDPSNMNDASTTSFSPAGTKQRGSGVSMNQATQWGTAAGQGAGALTSSLLDTELKNPEMEEFAIADTVMSNIPVVGQFYGMGNAINAPIKDWQADATKREGADSAEATAATALSGAIDPMDGWNQNAAAYEAGTISESEAAGNMVAQFFLPGYANQAVNRANEDARKNAEILSKLNDRDFGGTEMETQGPRDRYLKYGGKRYMANGGTKPPKGEPGGGWDPLMGGYTGFVSETPYIYESYISGEQREKAPVMLQQGFDNNGQPYPSRPTSSGPYNPQTFEVSGTPFLSANDPNYGVPTSTPQNNNQTPTNRNKVDWANIGETAAMGLLGNAGNLAYLFGEGKDYDKVTYDRYSPETVNASSSRRAIRDSMATSKEALRESGRLDRSSLAQIGTQTAKQLADAEERVRLGNVGILNDAQARNVEIGIREQEDTARNKGAALTNYYNALNALGQNTQAAYRGHNLRMSDAEKQRLVEENNIRLRELIAKMDKMDKK